MGIYLNPGNIDFSRAVNSEIYIDKSELINYTNNVIDTEQRFICVSRPRNVIKLTENEKEARVCLYVSEQTPAITYTKMA